MYLPLFALGACVRRSLCLYRMGGGGRSCTGARPSWVSSDSAFAKSGGMSLSGSLVAIVSPLGWESISSLRTGGAGPAVGEVGVGLFFRLFFGAVVLAYVDWLSHAVGGAVCPVFIAFNDAE